MLPTLPFLRRPITALSFGAGHVVRLHAVPTRTGVRMQSVDTEPAGPDPAAALARLAQRWGRTPRFVVASLGPEGVRHRLETMPELDADEREAYVAQRLRALVPAEAEDRFARGHAFLPGDPSRLLLFAAERAPLEEMRRALQAAGLTPLSLVSLLPSLGYAFVSDPAFMHGAVTVVWEGAGQVGYAEGYPVALLDADGPGEAPQENTLLVASPADAEAPAVLAPALALAMLARFRALPRAELLSADDREAAAAAYDRHDASRVLTMLAALVLLVCGVFAWRLHTTETRLTQMQARVSAQRPDLDALERAEARLRASETQGRIRQPSIALAPLLDAVARRVPPGVRLTEVRAAADSVVGARVMVAGTALRDALVPAYLDALGQSPLLTAPQLRFVTRAAETPVLPHFELVVLRRPAAPLP